MKVHVSQLPASTRRALERDLQAFPQPWLDFMDSYGVQLVVLDGQETLADSTAVAREAVADEAGWKARVQSVLVPALAAVEPGTPLVDHLHSYLDDQGSPFRVASHHSPVNLDELAAQRNVGEAYRQQWREELLSLNAPWSFLGPDGFQSTHGVFLLPPVPTAHGWLSDRDYQNAVTTTAESVGESLGLNRGAEQRVLLHSRYLGDDAPEIGGYRVAIHEMGHALDYALEGLPDSTGYGQHHKDAVLACFEEAKSFTSDRADDSVREFFAEAVEAYLTEPSQGFDFRPDNHQAVLRERNPRMAAYLDHLFQSVPGADWMSKPPAPVGLPEGFPDPDRDPIYLG
ncbi:MAG: hypothetical protein KF760_21505 [Candidatus Eremiobacteraeota bacterium]|nr:hypothetical protein [Candidatus Eremiobacteraeota bacterium]MCW5872748.1 hypothetical protein [Candidatus Eremiobacteraeota bacterium]